MKYFIKAMVINNVDPDMLNMMYKQVLIVREKPQILKENNTITDIRHVKTLKCCKMGHTLLTSKFNKNVFTTNEFAEGEIRIDNSRCSIPIRMVSFCIE